ncbi:piezo-type mechanosensitive ion channel homolog isoform X2 [Dendrobium catenatum]|uniref:piezo-type mechanosensitive ion channel homolog isoform X2 n=1 Tax=Dendrobium catenatum TaxID=906689 RepID=UPI00109FA856|nr:piezo-type mechanosensitive ion channel homolog isoform X2 [Dendrobium catenatum]
MQELYLALFRLALTVGLLLQAASLLDWSLISLTNLLIFLAIQLSAANRGSNSWRVYILLWCTIFFSFIAIVAQIIFSSIWCIEGNDWKVADTWWAKVIGFVRIQPMGSRSVIFFIVIQLSVGLIAFVEVHGSSNDRGSCWSNFSSTVEQIGSPIRIACCLLLPAIQLVVGISHPSWIFLPFFVCSCVGLVDWSLTSNFLGLFRWWRILLFYACFSIFLFCTYQLPLKLPAMAITVADFIGLYKIDMKPELPELCSSISLIVFFLMLSSIKCNLDEMDSMLTLADNTLAERLLPPRHSFFIREFPSGVRHTNALLRGLVFRIFSINFFTYGFPVLLIALSLWSLSFASICAFGLLAYVGYVLFTFPSLFKLHRLNGLLLVFILLWAVSTYIFNVAFTFLNKELRKDMEIWETIGLWHYPIPGLFLFAQFCLGVFVSICNLVNNSVFLYLNNEGRQSLNDDSSFEDKEDTKVLIIATLAWGLRKCSRAITLALIFLRATKPGYIHAVYLCFFLLYLLSHSITRKIHQALILFCGAHYSLLYLLQLDLISKTLEQRGSMTILVLSQLGITTHTSSRDFIEISVLLCFCAIQHHGLKMIVSLSSIVQHTPHPPFGFSMLKAGLNKSVLLSVYAAQNSWDGPSPGTSHEKLIASYLSKVSQKCLSTYRSYGTYVVFLTILLTLYLVTPNYLSFGYLFFLLLWIIGRQLVGKTRRRLWFPLKLYSTIVFVFSYVLSTSESLESYLSKWIDLYAYLGYNPKSSLVENIWESLAVLIVMQLYSYERRQSRYNGIFEISDASETGFLGFVRRFLIWHCEKILSVAVFYAALSPISAFGFLYLLCLIICSILPKTSRIPSKLVLLYSGLLVMSEYLFQLWGKEAHMFPGQKLYGLSLFLGLRLFKPGFWGIESGLRGNIMVIVACTLQYNVFHWLEKMPSCLLNNGKWEEPCQLFVATEHDSENLLDRDEEKTPLVDSSPLCSKKVGVFISSKSYQTSDPGPSMRSSTICTKKYSLGYLWGSSKESHKWNKKIILALRKERLEMQKTTLIIYMKFWIENIFRLHGLEINMIVLLVASFTALNAISLFYITCLVICIFLQRDTIRKLWPIFVLAFASILVLEYFAFWKNRIPWIHFPVDARVRCHDCWSSSSLYFDYCTKCWLGIVVDDPRTLVSYYLVFIFSSLKLRSDHLNGFSESHTYHQMMSQRKNASVWRDLSFETKSFWTFLDYMRLYLYCHLLDIVLALILITGTMEYDILHLGYLGFALVYFRMRLEILKKKNQIFRYLRIYNLILIVLSLAYQSPFLGDFSSSKCGAVDYIYEVIGFYKYDYGFEIKSRSALVEIIIFLLVSMQSYIFSSKEFEYVARYLETEQVGAMVREQEKRAARKAAQLQDFHKSEEDKRHRNVQVEKMKSEMLNLQTQLKFMNYSGNVTDVSAHNEGLRQRRSFSQNIGNCDNGLDNEFKSTMWDQEVSGELESSFYFPASNVLKNGSLTPEALDIDGSPFSARRHSSLTMELLKVPSKSISEISELPERYANIEACADQSRKRKGVENPLVSAVQLLGDGVSQVQSLGNQAVTNIANFLNIKPDENDSNDHSLPEDEIYYEIESQENAASGCLDRKPSAFSNSDQTPPASLQVRRIFRYIWSQMRSNNDVVCYCFFVLIFLWNFSLLSMIYLAALFLYALCVNSGPSYIFWVVMLIYTEINILLQYLYQIIIQHCGLSIHIDLLQLLGFPENKIKTSFVISTLPLFLVYVSTLLQSSITAKDGEWAPVLEFKFLHRRKHNPEEITVSYSFREKLMQLFFPLTNLAKLIARSFSRYWMSLTRGSESPPYFVQLSMMVNKWPDDGIQPQKIESGINRLLKIVHEDICHANIPNSRHSSSRVRIQSIERSQENSDIALAILEVMYASPLAECPAAEWYWSLTPASDVAKELLLAQSSGIFEEIGFSYPVISVIGGGKKEVDLYAYIFGVDLTVFFLVAIFYQSVIKNINKLLDVYQLEDQFPKEFVFILMVLFFLIVLDRIIYLCSFTTAKIILYLLNIFLFTYSVTRYAWYMQPSHKRIGGFALRAIYLTKAVSLALQAVQIRYGIPNKSTLYRQFLTSKVSQINYLGFRLYRALPFLYELRCVLDWSCTTTSLTMYDWLKLEDIYSSLFLVKCDAVLNRASHKQGQKQSRMTKFCSGICLFFILICVIWAPMLMYSSGNPTNIANPIKDVSVHIDIKATGGRLTPFQTALCEILPYQSLELFDKHYLETFNVQDIQLICCQSDSSTMWLVPPVVQQRYIRSLNGTLDFIFTWVFMRERPKGKEAVKYESFVEQSPDDLKQVLNGTEKSIRFLNAYPRYFRVTSSGEVRRLEQTDISVSGDLFLNHGSPSWWSFHDANALRKMECEGMSGPLAIVVSEETPQGILGETLSKFSIWSLYITFVLAVGRFIRLQCSDIRMRIPYEDLPSCDRLIAICEGIYAARAEGELEVEEVLYSTLVKIYRSPDMLLKYTNKLN